MHKKKIIVYIFLLAAFLLYSCEKDDKETTGAVYGIITDADNGEPIRGATVTLSPGGHSASTGSDGRFEFTELLPKQYNIQAAKSEYQTNIKTITIFAGKVASGDMRLSKGVSKIKLSTNSLNFGATSNTLTFSIMNVSTSGSVSWDISNTNNWIEVTPNNGTINADKSSDVIVSVLRDKITEDKDGSIIVSSGGESLSVSITVKYTDNGSENPGGANLKAGLVAYYTFDSEDAKDATDNELHANLIQSPSFTPETSSGKGKALILNSVKEQYMNIPYNPFKGQTNYSISMWVKDFGQGILFSGISRDHTRSDIPRLIAKTDGRFTFYTCYDNYDSTLPFVYIYTPLQDGNWHMITVVCKSKSSSKCTKYLYVDGVLVDSNEDYTGESSQGECTKIHIGGNGEGKYTSFTSNMVVDNIRIYTKSLDAETIKAIYDFEK